eukprot:GHVU01081162.1.p1 GENE.GHVU01081162.1~~GHVU01081162.1.p1  ORF type:complete len:106 (+),score=1.66 GHVU01081162.1:2080-2397(+)
MKGCRSIYEKEIWQARHNACIMIGWAAGLLLLIFLIISLDVLFGWFTVLTDSLDALLPLCCVACPSPLPACLTHRLYRESTIFCGEEDDIGVPHSVASKGGLAEV